MNRIAWLIATWFGCGLWPKGPGTAGSVAALLLGAGAVYLWPAIKAAHFAVFAWALFFPAVWACTRLVRITGRKDPQIAVVDEVAGQWLTLAGAVNLEWPTWLAALALFRLFDIAKPWPVRQVEALPAGWGIMADDMMAGLYGALGLRLLTFAVPALGTQG
ncbi:MAG: phosphatidylglycerophosphatase A [Acidobacteria bacterium]|nr:phosphatidylglycerophosphatase A [Acidobacteriota bacterium]